LVADLINVKRFDSSGTLIQTYDVTGEDTWFSLNLDPDGTSFWSGDYGTGKLYKFDIATGATDNQLQTIDTGVGSDSLYGVTVFGEITAGGGGGGVIPEPATMLLLGSGLIGLAGYGRKKFFKK
jgi:hypothetical protein